MKYPKLANVKNILITIFVIAVFCYLCIGLIMYITEHQFHAKVERFIVENGQDTRVSLSHPHEKEARGYEIKNYIYPPFYFSLQASQIKDKLIEGETYCFKTVGKYRRFPRHYPVIIDFGDIEKCPEVNDS